MRYNKIGQSGLNVSVLGLGTWLTFGTPSLDRFSSERLFRHALEAGINFFDTADSYSNGDSEAALGELISKLPRHDLVLSSKVFFPTGKGPNDFGLSRKHIRESLDRSLSRLGVDYLDMYLCHRFDKDVPLEETLSTIDDACRNGKILYWGTSEWPAEKIEDAFHLCSINGWQKPSFEQSEFNLLRPNRVRCELKTLVREDGLGIVGWSPLANGYLSGKYCEVVPESSRLASFGDMRNKLQTNRNREFIEKVSEIAENYKLTLSQLSLVWTLQEKSISSILMGVTSERQLAENLSAVDLLDNVDEAVSDVEQLLVY